MKHTRQETVVASSEKRAYATPTQSVIVGPTSESFPKPYQNARLKS